MALDVHRVLIRTGLVVLGGVVLLMLRAYRRLAPYDVPDGVDVFAVAQGTWAWTNVDHGCDTAPHHITFSSDHRVMFIAPAHPWHLDDGRLDSLAVYDILQSTRRSIRGAIRGETRKTDDGKPVVWDLVLKSPDRYAWHRTDWGPVEYTGAIARCPDPLRHLADQDSIRSVVARVVPLGTPISHANDLLWRAGINCSKVTRLTFTGGFIAPRGATTGVDCELRHWDQAHPPWSTVFFAESAGVVAEERVTTLVREGHQ